MDEDAALGAAIQPMAHEHAKTQASVPATRPTATGVQVDGNGTGSGVRRFGGCTTGSNRSGIR